MADAKIQYCRTADGVGIAYTIVGQGPPLLYMRRFMAPGLDDELKFSFSTWEPLAAVRSIVLMDIRGSGLSEPAPRAAFDDWIHDMEAVVSAVGADAIDLAGELTPCHFAAEYAIRHPGHVANLVLWNPAPKGSSPRARMPDWQRELAAKDWWSFVNLLALQVFGWRRAEVAERFAQRLRLHFTAEQYEHMMDAIESVGAGEASDIKARTLIISDENHLGAADENSVARNHAFTRQLAATIPGAQLSIIRRGDFTGAGDAAVQFLEPDFQRRTVAGRGAAAVILFTDIVDSTALTERMGDTAFREKTRALDTTLRSCVRDHGGAVIEAKTLGDGILATFPAASQAIAAALACGRAGEDAGLPLHLGLHAGDVIRESDNVFGGAVNIAARISALSAPGEVLVSATVRDLGRTSAGVTFEDRGEHALKGIAEPQRVFAVRAGEV